MVKVHVVGDDVHIRMEDMVLSDHLLQDVSNTGWEDQQRHLVLSQTVKKDFVAFPEDINTPLIRHMNQQLSLLVS